MTARISGMGIAVLLVTASGARGLLAQDAQRGKAVYEKWCLECHGETGEGNGSAAKFMLPPPRNFTQAIYQIRSTASGEVPTDADILRMVEEGMPGTAMPEWRSKLSSTEMRDVVAYLKTFSTFFEGATPTAVNLGSPPGSSAEGIEEGRQIYDKMECFKCHGRAGRGDGTSAPTLKDDAGFPIWAADLTQNWTFNGGRTVEDIFRRMRTGLDGTPMPSFSDVIDAKIVTEEQLWRVAQYVHSLSPEDPPEIKEVIRAGLATGTLPSGPSDSAWNQVEPTWIALVGQIIEKPRWFMPAVPGVWVRALHDGNNLSVRLSWDDRSKSPSPPWDEWLGRVRQAATDIDGPLPEQQGPDRFWVQFPKRVTDDAERPYFLGGDTRRPVYLWRWASTPDASEEGTGTGLGKFARQSGDAQMQHSAVYEQGEWRLQFTRPLVPADTAGAPTFAPGRAIPIAFFASDGSNGETEGRGSVSSWYAIYLDVPTPSTVYIIPVAAVLLTAGLCFTAVWRAQQRGPKARRR